MQTTFSNPIVSDSTEVPGPSDTDASHPMHHHIEPIGTYIKVFIALMVMLVVTYAAALINLDHVFRGANLTVAMIIAVIKASLVVAIFMHVKDGSKLLWVFATCAFFWLAIMFIMTFTDYNSRGWVPGQIQSSPPEANVRAASLEHMNTRDDLPVSPPKE